MYTIINPYFIQPFVPVWQCIQLLFPCVVWKTTTTRCAHWSIGWDRLLSSLPRLLTMGVTIIFQPFGTFRLAKCISLDHHTRSLQMLIRFWNTGPSSNPTASASSFVAEQTSSETPDQKVPPKHMARDLQLVCKTYSFHFHVIVTALKDDSQTPYSEDLRLLVRLPRSKDTMLHQIAIQRLPTITTTAAATMVLIPLA
jgi:hypothetical protein